MQQISSSLLGMVIENYTTNTSDPERLDSRWGERVPETLDLCSVSQTVWTPTHDNVLCCMRLYPIKRGCLHLKRAFVPASFRGGLSDVLLTFALSHLSAPRLALRFCAPSVLVAGAVPLDSLYLITDFGSNHFKNSANRRKEDTGSGVHAVASGVEAVLRCSVARSVVSLGCIMALQGKSGGRFQR